MGKRVNEINRNKWRNRQYGGLCEIAEKYLRKSDWYCLAVNIVEI